MPVCGVHRRVLVKSLCPEPYLEDFAAEEKPVWPAGGKGTEEGLSRPLDLQLNFKRSFEPYCQAEGAKGGYRPSNLIIKRILPGRESAGQAAGSEERLTEEVAKGPLQAHLDSKWLCLAPTIRITILIDCTHISSLGWRARLIDILTLGMHTRGRRNWKILF